MAKNKKVVMTKVKSVKTPAQKFATGLSATLINVILMLFSLSCIFPLVWMFYSSETEEGIQCRYHRAA